MLSIDLAVSSDVKLFISIMSGINNFERREAVRQTWLSNVPSDVRYRFLSDNESPKELDLLSVDVSGPGVNIWNHGQTKAGISNYSFSEVNQLAMRWALENAPFEYYLRIDDDSYLCLGTLMHQLRTGKLPSSLLYAGLWHTTGECDEPHPDESFVLFTRDVVEFLANPPLPFFHEFFGGRAFGRYLSAFDLNRMENAALLPLPPPDLRFFCARHLSSHHVAPAMLVRNIHALQNGSTMTLTPLPWTKRPWSVKEIPPKSQKKKQ